MVKFFLFSLIMFAYTSCNSDGGNEDITPKTTRTVMVYMVVNDDVYQNALDDINEMEKGWNNYDGDLIVYINSLNGSPSLLKITSDKSDEIVSPVIKRYQFANSCELTNMKAVFTDIMTLYPSNAYGAILWSQATGWLPVSSADNLRSFGDDSGSSISISDLAKALPAKLDFIIFDASLMGNIESAYELKTKAKYILASSTEIRSKGYPYDKIMRDLFTTEVNLPNIAEEYFNFYDELTGESRSATISLIKTAELDKLAEICNNIIKSGALYEINLSTIQHLDMWHENVFYDLGDFMKKSFSTINLDEFNEQLNKVVVYKRNTPYFFNQFPIRTYSGLSCYIPNSLSQLNNAYKQTAWGKASGLNSLIE